MLLHMSASEAEEALHTRTVSHPTLHAFHDATDCTDPSDGGEDGHGTCQGSPKEAAEEQAQHWQPEHWASEWGQRYEEQASKTRTPGEALME